MKTAFFIGFVAASLSYGEELVVVEPLGLAGRETARTGIPVVGGEPVKFEVAVEAPVGAKFFLCADTIQLTRDLEAPLQRDLLLGPELSFPTAERRKLTVEVPLPEVKQPTFVQVNFRAGREGPAAGQALFIVFPKMAAGELARVLGAEQKAAGSRLAIFGKSPALREFFKDQKIGFEDLGEEYPKEFSSGLVVLGEVTAADLETHRPAGGAGRAILFVRGARQPPGVYQTITPTGSLTKVTLPLLFGLADNPQNRNLFLDLIKQQLHPAGSAATP